MNTDLKALKISEALLDNEAGLPPLSSGNNGSEPPASVSHGYPDNYFEGPEKNLEIDFLSGVGDPRGCRSFTREQLDAICHEAKCLILSSISNESLDAYVLSESSLFVYSHKIVMKTCGTTTLLRCLPLIFEYSKALGMRMEWMGYSRKNFTVPSEQIFPHTSFAEETRYLLSLPETAHGQAHVLGPMTGDHWFVFVADSCDDSRVNFYDRNLDIKMFDIDPAAAAHFYRGPDFVSSAATTEASGIAHLCPGATIDAQMFDPCGYSMNGLLYDSYTTMHITPQPEFSYASFETNTRLPSYTSLLKNILSTFRPRRVVITMFADDGGLAEVKDNIFDLASLHVARAGRYVRSGLSQTTFCTLYRALMADWTLDDSMPAGGCSSPTRVGDWVPRLITENGSGSGSGRSSPGSGSGRATINRSKHSPDQVMASLQAWADVADAPKSLARLKMVSAAAAAASAGAGQASLEASYSSCSSDDEGNGDSVSGVSSRRVHQVVVGVVNNKVCKETITVEPGAPRFREVPAVEALAAVAQEVVSTHQQLAALPVSVLSPDELNICYVK